MSNVFTSPSRLQKMKRKAHNRIIFGMEKRLQQSPVNYDHIIRNRDYGPDSASIGEIDLFAIKGNRMLIFEMKSNDRLPNYIHAVEQLSRSEAYFNKYRVYSFYVTPNRGRRVTPPYSSHRGLLGK